MPKYRLSPEERAAKKERKDHLRAIMQGLDIRSFDETDIRIPRDRNGEFEPQLVKKNQTTLTGDIEEKKPYI